MKNKSKLTLLFVSTALLMGCSKKELSDSSANYKVSNTGVVPTVITGTNNGGNVSCEEAANFANLPGYSHTTGKQDYPFNNNSFGNDVLVTTDGTYVSWSISPPSGYCVENVAVIVKGGSSANVYYYEYGETSDSGLASPSNSSGTPAGLSNLTVCYNLVACQNECEWAEETAFGGGLPGAGNAWWYAIDASSSGTYPIYAGQQPVAGAFVYYDSVSDEITINLGSGMQLQNVSEPVKVEGYNQLPSERPSAGLFQLYKGSNLTIQGDGSTYYVVHLDVEVCS